MAKAKKVTKKKTPAKSKTPAKIKKPLPNQASGQKIAKSPRSKTVVAELVDSDVIENKADEFQAIEPDKAYTLNRDDIELDDEATKSITIPTMEKSVTTTDPLLLYLNEIRKYPVLSREEEQIIAKKYVETKDPEAAQKLVKSNLRFVVKVAAEYSKFGARMIDLIQEGNVGLMHAVKEFNPYKGTRLITYAVWWIRGYIQEYLMRQYSMVRIGTTQNQRKLFYQLQKEKDALDAMGIEPNIGLLSSRLGIPEDEVSSMAQRMSGRDVSLDRPVDDDSGTLMTDLQKETNPDDIIERIAREEQLSQLNKAIDELRPQLNEREKILLEERVLNDEPLTLQEIGEKYGITREAVRQAEARLMKKIKDKMENAKSKN